MKLRKISIKNQFKIIQINSKYRIKTSLIKKYSMKMPCMICLKNLHHRRPVTVLACGHKFDNKCINKWTRRSLTCPICRAPIIIAPLRTCRFQVPVGYRLVECGLCQKVFLMGFDSEAIERCERCRNP